MPRLLVFQHVAAETAGTLDPFLRGAGFRLRYVNFERTPDSDPDPRRYDGLVVLGGSMNVDQTGEFPHLLTEIEVLKEALVREMPILGICLGAQLLAAALGAPVHPAPVKEIGWYPLQSSPNAGDDALLRHVTHGQHVFQWHSYTFAVPPDAVHLASTATCANQAFRYGSNAYGLQFHPEVDREMIARWLSEPSWREELETLQGPDHAREVHADTHSHIGPATEAATRVFGAFAGLFRRDPRHRALDSR
ncbi:MAG: gamma-glutamyl-gamma-aminobutyrate hydrolase family protein [Gammaproteobacteria bacterium]|nr:gamma-glutamyl-gamma-aminobutyrate hydrolase family protein [Gammaproteobacteria bacterium]